MDRRVVGILAAIGVGALLWMLDPPWPPWMRIHPLESAWRSLSRAARIALAIGRKDLYALLQEALRVFAEEASKARVERLKRETRKT